MEAIREEVQAEKEELAKAIRGEIPYKFEVRVNGKGVETAFYKLPPREAGSRVWRDWLTHALRPEKGWVVEAFERYGRQKTDPCVLVLANGVDRKAFRWAEQKELMSHSSLRTNIHYVTDGFCDFPVTNTVEAQDFWLALVRFGEVLTHQSAADEVRGWLDEFLGICEVEDRWSLTPAERGVGLCAFKGTPLFTRQAALNLGVNHDDRDSQSVSPLLIIDSRDGARYIRCSEFVNFLRYCKSQSPISEESIDGRLREIDVEATGLYQTHKPARATGRFFRLPVGW